MNWIKRLFAPKKHRVSVMYFERQGTYCASGMVTYDADSFHTAQQMHRSDYPHSVITMMVSTGDCPQS